MFFFLLAVEYALWGAVACLLFVSSVCVCYVCLVCAVSCVVCSLFVMVCLLLL